MHKTALFAAVLFSAFYFLQSPLQHQFGQRSAIAQSFLKIFFAYIHTVHGLEKSFKMMLAEVLDAEREYLQEGAAVMAGQLEFGKLFAEELLHGKKVFRKRHRHGQS